MKVSALAPEAAGEVATSEELARKSELSEPGEDVPLRIGRDLFGEEPGSMAPVTSAAGFTRPDICIFLTSSLLTGEGEEYIVDVRAECECRQVSRRGGELGTLSGTPGEWSGGSGRASPLRPDLAARLAGAVDDADRP